LEVFVNGARGDEELLGLLWRLREGVELWLIGRGLGARWDEEFSCSFWGRLKENGCLDLDET